MYSTYRTTYHFYEWKGNMKYSLQYNLSFLRHKMLTNEYYFEVAILQRVTRWLDDVLRSERYQEIEHYSSDVSAENIFDRLHQLQRCQMGYVGYA